MSDGSIKQATNATPSPFSPRGTGGFRKRRRTIGSAVVVQDRAARHTRTIKGELREKRFRYGSRQFAGRYPCTSSPRAVEQAERPPRVASDQAARKLPDAIVGLEPAEAAAVNDCRFQAHFHFCPRRRAIGIAGATLAVRLAPTMPRSGKPPFRQRCCSEGTKQKSRSSERLF